MVNMVLSVAEPFTSPAWGSNFVLFSSEGGLPVEEEGAKDYIKKACRYARHYQVTLVPERFILMGYQCMCLISPQGQVLGAARGLFRNGALPGAVLRRSAALSVFSTPFGGICLCVDADIYHPETGRIAKNKGAHILIGSQFIDRGDYNTNMVLSGIWGAAQSNGLLAVCACNQFNCVCAPRSITAHDDGFLVPPNLKTPMTAKLSADALAGASTLPPINRKFYAMHQKELMR